MNVLGKTLSRVAWDLDREGSLEMSNVQNENFKTQLSNNHFEPTPQHWFFTKQLVKHRCLTFYLSRDLFY